MATIRPMRTTCKTEVLAFRFKTSDVMRDGMNSVRMDAQGKRFAIGALPAKAAVLRTHIAVVTNPSAAYSITLGTSGTPDAIQAEVAVATNGSMTLADPAAAKYFGNSEVVYLTTESDQAATTTGEFIVFIEFAREDQIGANNMQGIDMLTTHVLSA